MRSFNVIWVWFSVKYCFETKLLFVVYQLWTFHYIVANNGYKSYSTLKCVQLVFSHN